MTNGEAREILRQIRKQKCVSECDYSCPLYESKTFCLEEEALDLAIKALEAQPCIEDYPTCTECEHYDKEKHYCPRFCQIIKDTLAEAQPTDSDLISREDVMTLQAEYAECMSATRFWEFRDKLRNLPSVTPQQDVGKWIKVYPLGMDYEAYMCSKCKTGDWDITIGEYKFCPYCGQKKEGVEDGKDSAFD